MDHNIIINTIANCDTECALKILKSACNKELFDAAKDFKIIESIPWEDVNNIIVEFNLTSSKKSKRTLKNIKKYFGIDHLYERKIDSYGDYVVERADIINSQIKKLCEFVPEEQEAIGSMVVTEYTNIVIYTNKKNNFIKGINWLKSDDVIDRLAPSLIRQTYLSLDLHIRNSTKWIQILNKIQNTINYQTKILNIDVGPYTLGPLNICKYITNKYDKYIPDTPDRYINQYSNNVSLKFQSINSITNFNIN